MLQIRWSCSRLLPCIIENFMYVGTNRSSRAAPLLGPDLPNLCDVAAAGQWRALDFNTGYSKSFCCYNKVKTEFHFLPPIYAFVTLITPFSEIKSQIHHI